MVDLPWDVAELFNYRKHLDTRAHYKMLYENKVVLPTPRTMDSVIGFSRWIEWAEQTDKELQDKNKTFWEVYGVSVTDDHVIRFDHIEWARCGELVCYNTNYESPYYLEIVPCNRLAELGVQREMRVIKYQPQETKKSEDDELSVFGK